MQLLRLGIRNYRVIRSADIDIVDDVTGIIGPNGAGKSSLIEAITWAIYGNQAARSGKDEIKRQSATSDDDCRVVLAFSTRGVTYEITRALIGPTQRQEVQISADGQAVALGVKDSLEFVVGTLGLTFQGFLTSFLARQQELNTLSDVPPARRRDHLAAMLGVQQLDNALVRAKGDNRVLAGQAATLERQLAGFEDLGRRIEATGQNLGQLESGTPRLEQAMTTAEKAASETAHTLELWQGKQTRWVELNSGSKAETETIRSLRRDVERLSTETAQLGQEQLTRRQLGERLSELAAAPEQLERVRESGRKLELRRKSEVRLQALSRDLEAVAREISTATAVTSCLRSRLGDHNTDLADQHAQAQKDLELLRAEYSEGKGKMAALDKEISALKTQIAQAADLGADSVCRRCRRPFGDDLPQIREHLAQEYQALVRLRSELAENMAEKERQGTLAKERLQAISDRLRQQQEDRVALEVRTSEMANLDKHRAAIESEAGRLRAEIKACGQVDFDPAQQEKLSGQVQMLKTLSAQAATLEGRLQRLPEAIAERDRLTAKLAVSEQKLEDLQAGLRQLGFDPERYAEAGRKYSAAQAQRDAARTALLTHQKEVELARAHLDDLLVQKQQHARMLQELEECRADHYYGEKLTALLATYRQEIVSNIRPRLGSLSAGLFDEMTGGKYNLVELDDKYNLRIFDNGEFFGVERFSGGEKDLANLCLRLSISLALTEAAGLDRSFVILDEVFGSQDDERKELVVKSLTRLLARFPQILLITHIEDIKDRVGRLVQVVPTGRGYSEVIVDGQAV
ncbi:MAG: SMC family ATPase [bacterium]